MCTVRGNSNQKNLAHLYPTWSIQVFTTSCEKELSYLYECAVLDGIEPEDFG